MDWPEVLRRIEAGEDSETESKRGLGDLRGVGQTVCSFANSKGGLLVLGVDDGGEIPGVRESSEAVQERLTSFLHSGCSSPLSARIGKQLRPQGWVHWVEVPHQRGFEPLRYNGRVWVRRGRASVEPSPTELQELYNAFGYVLTEERYIEAGRVDDIDLHSFRQFLRRLGIQTDEQPQPPIEQDLLNRGLLVRINGDLFPSLYGVMAFGKDPQRYPQTDNFWIECVAYQGTDRSDEVILVSEAKGRLDEQIDRAVAWVRGLGRFESYEGLDRKDTHFVPLQALREAVANAVAHRDYAITGSKTSIEFYTDRLEVTSPGTLPNHMTPESVLAGGHPRSRNELMANFLLALGKMEQRGRGWPIMRRLMREFNGTEPLLVQDTDSRFVRVTFQFETS